MKGRKAGLCPLLFPFCTAWGMRPAAGGFHAARCLGMPLNLLSSNCDRLLRPAALASCPHCAAGLRIPPLRWAKAGVLHRKIVSPDLGRVGLKKLAVRFEGCGEKRTFVENLKN